MKKLLLFVACSIFYCSFAQLPPNSFGEDFTLTDINGNEYNLYSTLDEGKTVILDLFAVWCGPCWDYAEAGVLEDLQEAYPDDVVVVAVEADPSTPENTIDGGGNSIGDWTDMIDYLLMDDPSGDVANDYALSYYPTIYKICPDRMVTEVGQLTSVNSFMQQINQCSSAQYSKDARLVSYTGGNMTCSGTVGGASVMIQNYSIGASLASCDIVTKLDGEIVNTTSWSGSLDTYQTDIVNIDAITDLPSGNFELTFEIDYQGDMDESNNVLSDEISFSEPTATSSSSVELYILTDNWGYETSWELLDGGGNSIASGENYDNETVYEFSWELDPGCYMFNVYDSYGDGVEASQWGAYDDGVVTLTDAGNNEIIWSEVSYGDLGSIGFEVAENNVNILESKDFNISIFPNPFTNFTNLSVNGAQANEMDVEIVNSLGKIVYSKNTILNNGANNLKIESGDLSPGLYYMNVMINGENNLKPLTIVK